MKHKFTGIMVFLVGALVLWMGVNPILAQHRSETDPSVSRPQGATPRSDEVISDSPIGIPPTLSDVRYRRCPINRSRVKAKYATIYGGKVYHFCSEACKNKFWENPQAAIGKIQNSREVPLTITNFSESCLGDGKAASREFFRVHRDSVTFYCSSGCRDQDRKQRPRTPVSREPIPQSERR